MADGTRRTRYPETLRLHAPKGINAALDVLAGRQQTTRSEVVRQVLMRECEVQGLNGASGMTSKPDLRRTADRLKERH
jgi:hypothetical protein